MRTLKTILLILFLIFSVVSLTNCNGSNDSNSAGESGTSGQDGEDGEDGEDAMGNITTDTTWATGSTYTIERDIVVKENVTLTIEPGAIVSLNPYVDIFIDGTLKAQGNSLNRIIIKNEGTLGCGRIYLTSTSTGNIVRYVEFQNNYLSISSSSVDIQYCKIINSVSAESSNGITITNASVSFTLSNCSLIDYGGSGIGIYNSQNNCDITFINCIITNFNYGVYLGGSNNTYVFNNCSIFNNSNYGILCSNLNIVTINSSNLYGNTLYDYYNLCTSNQDAKLNWWGTNDTSAIDLKIYDYNDSSSRGAVDYSSYLSSQVAVTGCGW